MNHVTDLLWDWLHGALSDVESDAVEAHLAECESCQAALDTQTELLSRAAIEVETNVAPSREAILGLATAMNRFGRFAKKVADLTDVALEQAKAWIEKMDDDGMFTETALEMMQIYHIEGGPLVENAIVGFVKIKAGESFPEHTHLGHEQMLVMQGFLRDEDGVLHPPGTLIENPAGMTHEIGAGPDVDLIYLNVTQTGIELFGMTFGPESPDM
jgi:anti-sigma factor ChrR (cupin superfamily)